MKLSLDWLNDYVDLSGISNSELVNRLTLSSCEVEEVYESFAYLKQVVVGKVLSVARHTAADKLSVCKVHVGDEILQIVCGAPNVRADVHVAVALIGSELPGGIKIQQANLRGVDSSGMLCSAKELGLESLFPGEGIIIFEDFSLKGKIGDDFSKVIPLCQTILEIDNKSITHRPDLWCHFGFAREISAVFRRPLKMNPLDSKPKIPKLKETPKEVFKIKIAKNAAHIYAGSSIHNIRVVQSPQWMQVRLLSVGQKCINNIVDASNYILLELAQPNHAFDKEKIQGNQIHVVPAGKDLTLKTLDGEDRKLPEESILIQDSKRNILALGGIMGGLESSITSETKNVFLESATFPREKIRGTLAKLSLRTDSAIRFEKGQDPAKAKPAILRFVELISETCPDAQYGNIVVAETQKAKSNTIKTSLDFLQQRLGFSIEPKEVEDVLSRLGFDVKKTKDKSGFAFSVKAPTYRSQYDITIPEDIVEELGRIRGYDNIKPAEPLVPLKSLLVNQKRLLERRIKEYLAHRGSFTETYNYSFSSLEENQSMGVEGLALKNPPRQDQSRLRVSLIPGLAKQAVLNQDRYGDIRLFELGRIYLPSENKKDILPVEYERLALIQLSGDSKGVGDESSVYKAYLELRALIEGVCKDILHIQVELVPTKEGLFHPQCAIQIFFSGKLLGSVGIMHPTKEKEFGLKRSAVIADLEFSTLFEVFEEHRTQTSYKIPSVFQDIVLEFSVLMSANTSTSLPVKSIEGMNIQGLQEIQLLEVYKGHPLKDGEKSASYRLVQSKPESNPTAEDTKRLLADITKELEKQHLTLR